ncbi:MAG: efflux RND transporter periplasmic adaptor subunit [Methyloceanibacter sp.]|jgi:Cu(I)/Ag(I) efflux system membrane fusion protein|nr:efflux RND transporter periplasmic adaptor subunit [Methyloceanibacter sp.]
MRRLNSLPILLLGIGAGIAFYWYAQAGTVLTPATAEQSTPAKPERKVLYYRNPMGLPDTSPVPKKDTMGMDYIPVFADEQEDGNTVKLSLDKIQRTGVKTEKVEARPIVQPVRAVGRVEHDEALLTIVSMRSDGYIEDLFVNKTGQHVKKGDPLFRVYSPQIQQAQTDLISATRAQGKMAGLGSEQALAGAMQRLRNLGVPQSRIDEVRKTGTNPRTIDWPAPADGDVIEKKIINGQRVLAGDELYRLADHSRVWIIADVAEADIAPIRVGAPAKVTLRADQSTVLEGKVTFIYPELKVETRTVPVRIELPNPDQLLRTSMYADVVFGAGDASPVTAIPDSAVIDSGSKQVVLVAKGDGRFEPRAVKLGRRGEGYAEITEGLKQGEDVVISANFLIDAESNLRAALQSFGQQETKQ